MLIAAMLICCSLLLYAGLIPPVCGENLTRPKPRCKNKFGGSRTVLDARLPWYTSGFK